MALNIDTQEADRLARALAELTGESLADAVTAALRERLEREREIRGGGEHRALRLAQLAAELRANYDISPVSRAEWDLACGDEL